MFSMHMLPEFDRFFAERYLDELDAGISLYLSSSPISPHHPSSSSLSPLLTRTAVTTIITREVDTRRKQHKV